MNKGTVILQARMGSTRLPGKVLMEIQGRPLLWYTIHALQRSPAVSRIVLATTEVNEDDALECLARREGIDCFRGSEEDVLDRYYQAACRFSDSYYFRATGDNPLLDVGNPGRTLSGLVGSGSDYACEQGMPLGSIVECFTRDALARCHREAQSAEYREHVTLFMRQSGLFRTFYLSAPSQYSQGDLRLTVDYPEDFERTERIIESLFVEGPPDFQRILDFCREYREGFASAP